MLSYHLMLLVGTSLATAGPSSLTCIDKELLAQIPQERQQQASQGLARISLPPRYASYGSSDQQSRAIRGPFPSPVIEVLLTITRRLV